MRLGNDRKTTYLLNDCEVGEGVGDIGGRVRPPAEVVIEGGRGAGVAKVIGDVTDAEARIVEPGRDGLAEPGATTVEPRAARAVWQAVASRV